MKHIAGLLVLLVALCHAQIAEWIHRYPGYGSSGAHDIAVDNSGNVYVTGWGANVGTSRDFLTIKYSSVGDTLWVRYYDGGANFYDEAYGLALDAAGNVYVTGRSIASGSQYDIATIKYNSAGVEQWVARYNGGGDDDDEAYDIAIDGYGNLYVTGFTYASGANDHYITIKYDNSGDTLWTAIYGGPDNVGCRANAVALDDSGNVYVTGEGYASASFRDYATIKYDASGNEEWVATYNGLTTYASDIAYDITVFEGYVYVTGESENANYDADYFTIKYSTSGDTVWTARYAGSGGSDDEAVALSVDNNGGLYITGGCHGASTNDDYVSIKYTVTGIPEWTSTYNGPNSLGDGASAIVVDNLGNVYVTGSSYATGPGTPENDYLTVKYDPSGVEQWNERYNGTGSTQDHAEAIAVDNAGYVYVTGSSIGTTSYEDVVTIKYPVTGINEKAGYTIYDAGFNLTVSPNPFHYITNIRYQMPNNIQDLELSIYDITGRLVTDLHEQVSVIGYQSSVSWDGRDDHNRELGSGVYFLRLTAGNYQETQELLLIR